jgi:hypothetical protein
MVRGLFSFSLKEFISLERKVPQRLKPVFSGQVNRSAEALRHPKTDLFKTS